MTDGIQFGCQVVAYGNESATIGRASTADRAGFDAITLPDHLFHPSDTEEYLTDPPWEVYTMLGAVAEATENATLFPAVADSVRRHPTLLAHATATLDRLSNGRGAIGLGAGEAFNLVSVPEFQIERPYTRFRETIESVLGLWASTAEDRFSCTGEYITLEDAHLGLTPVNEPHPPLYVGGYGPKMRTLTGRLADGWLPWIYDPETYERDLQRVLAAADAAGREPGTITRSIMLPTAVAADGEEARSTAFDRSRVNLALRPAILSSLGYPDLAESAPVMRDMAYDEAQRARLRAVAERIPDEAVEQIVIAGTPDEAIAQLDRFVDAGVDFPILVPVGDFEQTVTHFADTIIPALR